MAWANPDASEFVFNPDAVDYSYDPSSAQQYQEEDDYGQDPNYYDTGDYGDYDQYGYEGYDEYGNPVYGEEFGAQPEMDPEYEYNYVEKIPLFIRCKMMADTLGMEKKDLKAFFNMMCEEDDVWEYDNNGITLYEFGRIYNEALKELNEYDYDSDEEEEQVKRRPVKVKKFLADVGFDNIERIIDAANRPAAQKIELPAEPVFIRPVKPDNIFRPPRELPIDKQELARRAMAQTIDKDITMPDETRNPVNIVFIGHVDAGKSTICGQVLLLTGKIDARTLEKYEQEAKKLGRDSWWLAYVMDQNEEEKEKGKTVEVGKQMFDTRTKRFTILDAPGHKNYVPNMIGGTTQADYAGLVISARIQEFETGFERGGQTQEHSLLAKSAGVQKLIIIINKMDDPSVEWSQERYQQIVTELGTFLINTCKYNPNDLQYIPISGYVGENISQPLPAGHWYQGPTLLQAFEDLALPPRNQEGSLRIPITSCLRENGINVYGKVESGMIVRGQELIILPAKEEMIVQEIYNTDDKKLFYAKPGENVHIKLKGNEEFDIIKGYIMCDTNNWVKCCKEFECELLILDLHEHKQIMTAGYQAVLHLHSAEEACVISQIICEINVQAKKKIRTSFAKSNQRVIVKIKTENSVALESAKDMPQLARFTLRDEGKTIALGKVMNIVETY